MCEPVTALLPAGTAVYRSSFCAALITFFTILRIMEPEKEHH